ncbi:hypothetical protein GCM10010182_00170 [Actinomadura cremea]|nr:hypothetical protein GCM10010182_00170 [Actinomadura cremea]
MTYPRTTRQATGNTNAVASTTASGNALAIAERSFRLLVSGTDPLALNGAAIGHGLPPRPVNLGELRALLLGPETGDELKDAVWQELVHRSRSEGPAWIVGCAGVAMPGLKNTAARVLRTSPERFADDIVSELLTEFVAQLARIDLDRPHIAARLMLWARKGALRARGREARLVPCDPQELPGDPVSTSGDPLELLLEAVRQGVITSSDAELVITTRLEGVAVQDIARGHGVAARRLYKQRRTAEERIIAALHDGRLCGPSL